MDERVSRGLLLLAFITASACDISESSSDGGTGGKPGAGGASHGGTSSSGASSSGATNGGAVNGGTSSTGQSGGASGSVSGGATSLIAAPLRGMTEAELTQLFDLLLASGLDIGAVNAVRPNRPGALPEPANPCRVSVL